MTESLTAGGGEMLGPLLFLRGMEEGRLALAAVAMCHGNGDGPDPLLEAGDEAHAPRLLARLAGRRVLGYRFTLPAVADTGYRLGGIDYPVRGDVGGDLRIAYVSCNGQEEGDRDRPAEERNRLWARLCEEHRARPFHVMLQGGDQLYADEVVDEHPLSDAWSHDGDWRSEIDADALAQVREVVRAAYLAHYEAALRQPETAWIMARVPSVAMWDDHDIVDGWGSLPAAQLDAPVGRVVFEAAREAFLLFQTGTAPGEAPETAPDPTGANLGLHVALPGVDILAPDLRSERRPDRVMGEAGWEGFGAMLDRAEGGRVLVMSSVPALGPRLSLVERFLNLVPHAQKYEDDLRDQWQSRAHRAEWRRFLERLAAVHEGGRPVTLVSGEIHLATHGTMEASPGPVHQLVASGISHPAPPRAYAACLGALASFGEAPLPDRPIRLHPLPGQRRIYAAERNYLVIERRGGAWQAEWELEESGRTPPLPL